MKILLKFFTAIVLLLFVIVIGAIIYFRVPVNSYYTASERGFKIPAINSGFVPQGIDYDEESDSFYITGYMTDSSASPIYIVDKATGEITSTTLIMNMDGTPFDGHAGGLTVNGDYVYIAGGHDCCLYVMEKRAVIEGGEQNIIGTFSNKVSEDDYLGSAFVFVSEDNLVVGEFYREGNYPTLMSHKLTTTGGDYNQALAIVYPLDEEAQFGISSNPSTAISLPDLAQGMLIDNDDVYVSMSWGTSKSTISRYSLSVADNGKTIDVLGFTLPLLELDSKSLIDSETIAPMSEEIVKCDGRIYTMCESASNKYFFGKLTGGQYCYATDISFWK